MNNKSNTMQDIFKQLSERNKDMILLIAKGVIFSQQVTRQEMRSNVLDEKQTNIEGGDEQRGGSLCVK